MDQMRCFAVHFGRPLVVAGLAAYIGTLSVLGEIV
jgi:hypothetical protein